MRKGPWQVQIIDEEIVILLAVSRAYRNKPIDIISADNADKALAQMAVFNVNLFLLDLDMKDRSSFHLLEIMTERSPEIPVILMTTQDTTAPGLLDRIAEVRTRGCWHLLEKPFDYQKLLSFIDRGLEESLQSSRSSQLCATAGAAEKRRCRRFSRLEQINVYLADEQEPDSRCLPFLATLTDLSVGGIGLETRKKLYEKQLIHFDEKFMHQSGMVVWSREEDLGHRAGISFV
ncbi:PilZ domain-containing protein [Pelobacter seleniigenes]|uniref:PilZ domain-containing protein n=1 Tax=Pelobacter seleniigenes TaxID=407188 RepID=UPI0004A6EA8F|nr:PilZ domain-containing protein [Pelobacter seleniigenes]